MAIKICALCKMPFSQTRNETTCPTCAAEGESRFQRIKAYLYEHPGASATELVQQLGVTIRQIQQYLKEDRLEVVGEGFTGLKCELCGKDLKTGRYCPHCEREAAARQRQQVKTDALQELQEMKAERAAKRADDPSPRKQTGLRFGNEGTTRGNRKK